MLVYNYDLPAISDREFETERPWSVDITNDLADSKRPSHRLVLTFHIPSWESVTISVPDNATLAGGQHDGDLIGFLLGDHGVLWNANVVTALFHDGITVVDSVIDHLDHFVVFGGGYVVGDHVAFAFPGRSTRQSLFHLGHHASWHLNQSISIKFV